MDELDQIQEEVGQANEFAQFLFDQIQKEGMKATIEQGDMETDATIYFTPKVSLSVGLDKTLTLVEELPDEKFSMSDMPFDNMNSFMTTLKKKIAGKAPKYPAVSEVLKASVDASGKKQIESKISMLEKLKKPKSYEAVKASIDKEIAKLKKLL